LKSDHISKKERKQDSADERWMPFENHRTISYFAGHHRTARMERRTSRNVPKINKKNLD